LVSGLDSVLFLKYIIDSLASGQQQFIVEHEQDVLKGRLVEIYKQDVTMIVRHNTLSDTTRLKFASVIIIRVVNINFLKNSNSDLPS